ncbi:transcriptional regulator [Shewanella sp. Choline-02u-19]|jgi:DNA-binding transcriptional ArsR family regulator|uniref:ArsR/SmtB family transcription factor n=1 Tax=unclassified Shewanella TaxID=196818 RepID=UPI000C333FC7|nr:MULTISPECIES: metalloregulator ArsR/SmtB family transcription factor [unclassified Shewanella]PKG55361.1 transcriptional regulator [Shewanella sp. GutDb-MelDb]PKG76146.1 transcriptional regulator [Shewanella sp. GutCb]PKH56569.1 transcriptional regulator [Shewanella sp. Bg11-22]PKI30120.1 transcriptional regulator [Shewanella sp. Choline-02u-19]
MNIDVAAKALKELGHPTRLTLFRCLVKAGYAGLPVGQLQETLQIPNSTLSHHLSSLMSAGLVKQQREGRVLHCIPQFDCLDGLISFLQEECCTDEKC